MLHIKFQGNQPSGYEKEDFILDFYYIWAWGTFQSCDLEEIINFLSPLLEHCI